MPHYCADEPATTPTVEGKSQLVEFLASGCKPVEKFRLGAEQEAFVYRTDDLSPLSYDACEPGIRTLLQAMLRFGWEPMFEAEQLIGLARENSTITIEPGGQFELSSEPCRDAHQVFDRMQVHERELKLLAEKLGVSFLTLGYQPKHARSELPWMPKERYRIMRSYMPKQGALGLDMMQSTCALQVTTDFSCESDMVKKFRVALALQPVVTAMFANSPFVDGKLSGYLSFRAFCWSDTDAQRSGGMDFVFQQGMGFERYVDYALDVPMYFVLRDGNYLDASGQSFREFLSGRLPVLPGERPTLEDWENHLGTLFPQVRLKKYLEMRGADAGPGISRVPALAALWAGLLYDSQSLDAAWQEVKSWTSQERQALNSQVAQSGFKTPFRNRSIRDLSLWLLELSRQGLQRRAHQNSQAKDESVYLDVLQEAAESAQTFADDLVRRFRDEWHADIDVAIRVMSQESLS